MLLPHNNPTAGANQKLVSQLKLSTIKTDSPLKIEQQTAAEQTDIIL